MPKKAKKVIPSLDIIPRFTEEQLNCIMAWFDENAKPQLLSNEGEPIYVITIEMLQNFFSLTMLHRRSFHYPSYEEIMSEAEKIKVSIRKMLTKEHFIYMLDKWVLEPDVKHELKLAFKMFDTEKRNFLEVDEIKSIVTEYGDVFDEAETIEMLRDANVRGDGNVFYEDFVESMFSIAPELQETKVEYVYDNADEDPSVPPEPIIEEPPPVVVDVMKQSPKPVRRKAKKRNAKDKTKEKK